jgi:hypothetical protein
VPLTTACVADLTCHSIHEVLEAPSYRERARTLGERIVGDACWSTPVSVLEEAAARVTPVGAR